METNYEKNGKIIFDLDEIVRRCIRKAAIEHFGNYERSYIWSGDVEKFSIYLREILADELKQIGINIKENNGLPKNLCPTCKQGKLYWMGTNHFQCDFCEIELGIDESKKPTKSFN